MAKRYSKTKFFVLSRRLKEIRDTIFDRGTGKDEGFTGYSTNDDQVIYLFRRNAIV